MLISIIMLIIAIVCLCISIFLFIKRQGSSFTHNSSHDEAHNNIERYRMAYKIIRRHLKELERINDSKPLIQSFNPDSNVKDSGIIDDHFTLLSRVYNTENIDNIDDISIISSILFSLVSDVVLTISLITSMGKPTREVQDIIDVINNEIQEDLNTLHKKDWSNIRSVNSIQMANERGLPYT